MFLVLPFCILLESPTYEANGRRTLGCNNDVDDVFMLNDGYSNDTQRRGCHGFVYVILTGVNYDIKHKLYAITGKKNLLFDPNSARHWWVHNNYEMNGYFLKVLGHSKWSPVNFNSHGGEGLTNLQLISFKNNSANQTPSYFFSDTNESLLLCYEYLR